MTAPRICSRDGCTRHVFGRSLCVSHYNSMIKSLRRRGSTLFCKVDTWVEVQKALPGTMNQLVERTGITYNAILKTIKRQHASGAIHISTHLPPQQCGGARWVRVFAIGAGKDHVVSDKRKANYARKTRRENDAARRAADKTPSPVIGTRWNLAFFNPSEVRT